MDKPILFYEVRVHQNRITGGPVYVPAIVEREEAVPLETVIERAIDRGPQDDGGARHRRGRRVRLKCLSV